jgi:hypothetical protein
MAWQSPSIAPKHQAAAKAYDDDHLKFSFHLEHSFCAPFVSLCHHSTSRVR